MKEEDRITKYALTLMFTIATCAHIREAWKSGSDGAWAAIVVMILMFVYSLFGLWGEDGGK